MFARGHRTVLVLLLATSWLTACRHGARSKAKNFSRVEKNLLESGEWVNSIPSSPSGYATICSFNIQVLGKHKERQQPEARLMAEALAPCALVVVQEITAPPIAMEFPNGDSMDADPETQIIFDALTAEDIGFQYLLSPDDTGRWINHSESDGSEFFPFFYKPQIVAPMDMSVNGFLQTQLSGTRNCAKDEVNENTWDRVPYAQAFRFVEGGSDFVVINNHLHALGRKPCIEASETNMMSMTRRSEELNQIILWQDARRKEIKEKDYLIMGDMNLSAIELDLLHTGTLPNDEHELRSSYYDEVKQSYLNAFDAGFRSLNPRCVPTNISARACLDNALFNPQMTRNVEADAELQILNLKGFVRASGYCDDKPLVCAETEANFSRYFSDHNPVFFRWKLDDDDDE